MDNRLGSLTTSNGTGIDYAFLDDDQIATYRLSLDTDNVVSTLESTNKGSQSGGAGQSTIMGPRGTRLELFFKASTELQQSNFLFERFGSSVTGNATFISKAGGDGDDVIENYINTTIRVTGATTGYRIDVPVRYVKCIAGCPDTSS